MAKKHPLTRNNSRQRHRDGPCPPDWRFAPTGPPGMMPRRRPPPHRWSNTSTGPTAGPGAGRPLAAPSSGTTVEIGPPQLPRSARRHSALRWRAGPISRAWWDRRAPGTVAPWLPYRAGSLWSWRAIYQYLLMSQPPSRGMANCRTFRNHCRAKRHAKDGVQPTFQLVLPGGRKYFMLSYCMDLRPLHGGRFHT